MAKRKTISLTIDDTPLQVDAGTTIMEAAEQLGIRIPRLCYHPDLSLAGSCRVCIVDVKGMGYYMAACSSQVWEGMEVQTNSPAIRQARERVQGRQHRSRRARRGHCQDGIGTGHCVNFIAGHQPINAIVDLRQIADREHGVAEPETFPPSSRLAPLRCHW